MATPDYTDKQGQYLAFIFMYDKVNGRPPPSPTSPASSRSPLPQPSAWSIRS